jgi:hypothetical protein
VNSLSRHDFILVVAVGLIAGCSRSPTVDTTVTQLEHALPVTQDNLDLQLAIKAAKDKDYATGVTALQNVKKSPGLTAEQLMSVEQASQAMTAELVRRASEGDPRAKADLDRIERTRSQ